MDNTTSGILLVLIGFFLGFITYKKYNFLWNYFNTKLIRKYFGDDVTSVTLYIVSIVCIITGLLVSIGIVH